MPCDRIWSAQAVDTRLVDPACDLDSLAVAAQGVGS